MHLQSLRPHVALGLYGSLVGLLFVSLLVASGFTYAHYVALYLAALFGGYVVFWRLASARAPREPAGPGIASDADRIMVAVLILASAFVVAHLLRLGTIPVIDGLLETDYYVVMLIRQEIFVPDMHPLWKYGPNIMVKSVYPFLVLYFLPRSRYWLVLSLLVGGGYAVALMNKLFVVLLIVPAFIYAIATGRRLAAAALLVIPGLGLALLIFVQNPHLQPQIAVDALDAVRSSHSIGLSEPKRAALMQKQKSANNVEADDGEPSLVVQHSAENGATLVADTLYRRIILNPGTVMTAWFSDIPQRLPYAHGCGYRWLAAMLGCEYIPYARVINDIENPVLVAAGVHGSMTAASFVEDYANFGVGGLALSGVVMAGLLVLVGWLFRDDWKMCLALNAVPLILLMEIPLSTVILTGGWVVTIMLYLLITRGRRA